VSYLETRVRVVNARNFKECPLPHDSCLLVIHGQRQTFVRYLFAVHIQRERTQIVVAEMIRVRRHGAGTSVFFTMVNRSRFGMGTNTALSMESDCAPLENVKDFSSTLVRL